VEQKVENLKKNEKAGVQLINLLYHVCQHPYRNHLQLYGPNFTLTASLFKVFLTLSPKAFVLLLATSKQVSGRT